MFFFHDLDIFHVTVSVQTSPLMQMTHVYIVLESQSVKTGLSELSTCFDAVQIWTVALHISLILTRLHSDFQLESYLQSLFLLGQRSKVKVGVLRPVQQPGSYWDRSSELPLVGLEPTEVTAYD